MLKAVVESAEANGVLRDPPGKRREHIMISFLARMRGGAAEAADRSANPWRDTVERAMRGVEAISTYALLDVIGLKQTTGNARRIAVTMRGLGYVPLKSRRMLPGGFHTTLLRGWTRPYRQRPSRGARR
jgi:hypothetical protein